MKSHVMDAPQGQAYSLLAITSSIVLQVVMRIHNLQIPAWLTDAIAYTTWFAAAMAGLYNGAKFYREILGPAIVRWKMKWRQRSLKPSKDETDNSKVP